MSASRIVTRQPSRCRAIAAAGPAMPPPIMTTRGASALTTCLWMDCKRLIADAVCMDDTTPSVTFTQDRFPMRPLPEQTPHISFSTGALSGSASADFTRPRLRFIGREPLPLHFQHKDNDLSDKFPRPNKTVVQPLFSSSINNTRN